MTRPLHIWTVFSLCIVALVVALGWITLQALRLEDTRRSAERESELQERARLALWRIDASVSALLIRENARPPGHFEAFHSPGHAVTGGFQVLPAGAVLLPSPLISDTPENVLLFFQVSPDGRLQSPQVPESNARDVAENLYTFGAQIDAADAKLRTLEAVAGQRLRELASVEGQAGVSTASSSYSSPSSSSPSAETPGSASAGSPSQAVVDLKAAATEEWRRRGSKQSQNSYNQREFSNRAKVLADNVSPPVDAPRFKAKMAGKGAVMLDSNGVVTGVGGAEEPAPAPDATPYAGDWFGVELVLTRRATMNGIPVVQGVWLDWDKLAGDLLVDVADLFSHARFEKVAPIPVSDLASPQDDPLRLASLPVRLDPGVVHLPQLTGWSPLKRSLAIAWGCVLLAAVAVAVLLYGAVSLSERRATFVSAVTHEVRTPITTLGMYSEMLAEGMVTDATKQKQYLKTLCSEAARLGHLVENVMAYARLERGNGCREIEQISLGDILGRLRERLERRVGESGMTLEIVVLPDAEKTLVRVDVTAVEQIVFNLVDNACKYARDSLGDESNIVQVEADKVGSLALLRVRDQGRGISESEARHLFKPFQKSATEAAHSAPGVGLGLALCRRLGNALGGNVRLEPSEHTPGASFVLEIPAVPS